jgi:hypothetical protein
MAMLRVGWVMNRARAAPVEAAAIGEGDQILALLQIKGHQPASFPLSGIDSIHYIIDRSLSWIK